jgi:hypothetical protein
MQLTTSTVLNVLIIIHFSSRCHHWHLATQTSKNASYEECYYVKHFFCALDIDLAIGYILHLVWYS